ncbi:isocitrate lyase/phosphoenolpyruvate mutase family protein [Pendulispora albinea]|uniref:Isocitrate lyase/phosphoenolpyruvate mutase family protein n=1 Tax=Pendulispora albinea TaxID=2741071 RepID=A0ABZ2LPZ3_9BACT
MSNAQQIAHAATFRSLHAPGELVVFPNAWDAGSAALFVANGARAITTTSCAVAWSLGYADGEDLPLEELLGAVRRMVRAVSVPVSVDFERGYGKTPREVAESVTRVLETGAVAVNLEDGAGRPEALAESIAAAREAARRFGVDLFINSRTDIVLHRTHPPEQHVEESLARAKIFEEAGADGFFVPGLQNPDHIQAITRGTSLPLNVLAWPGLAPVPELRRLGVRRVTVGGRLGEVALEAARRACVELLQAGTYSFPVGEITYAGMNALFAPPRA